MSNVTNILQSLDLQQLKDVLSAVKDLIIQKSRHGDSSQPSSDQPNSGNSVLPDVQNYVDYHENFCKDEGIDLEFLAGELESLNVKSSKSCKKVQNTFISMLDEPYTWNSKNGSNVNVPESFNKFPVIKSILNGLKSKFDINLNSVLVSYYEVMTLE